MISHVCNGNYSRDKTVTTPWRTFVFPRRAGCAHVGVGVARAFYVYSRRPLCPLKSTVVIKSDGKLNQNRDPTFRIQVAQHDLTPPLRRRDRQMSRLAIKLRYAPLTLCAHNESEERHASLPLGMVSPPKSERDIKSERHASLPLEHS
ncbi:hypothetical protein EVAR_81368_1 [Eumeta japonica]|uniref:Uncharacterized protein n=1 Tax=Eumeta variegata TaxID=151549 RepID=A0A4C1WHB0_EUMVA|nr:hypothetical protein EVAR_81368_1 [Eumeta japonica]